MKNREKIMNHFLKCSENTLISVGRVYEQHFSDSMSRDAFMKTISRLYKDGEIERLSKGIYCLPKNTKFGKLLPSDKDILLYYTSGNRGVMIGYGLYNSLGISTQIPKHLIAYSSLSEEEYKQVRNVIVHKYLIDYSEKNKAIIRLMELLYHFKEIQDINLLTFLQCLENLSKEYSEDAFETVQRAVGYPKWTIAFLQEVLNYYKLTNSLQKYLSVFSNYKIPRIEELYEIARR